MIVHVTSQQVDNYGVEYTQARTFLLMRETMGNLKLNVKVVI